MASRKVSDHPIIGLTGPEGGILAGLSRHWAALRDQFGAMRCLLALGHHEEAREVLRYYGYLLAQAFDYLDRTGDDPLLRGLFPMLECAFEAQRAINDGSAESTMLFVAGGSRFLDWAERQDLWPSGRVAEARRVVAAVGAA